MNPKKFLPYLSVFICSLFLICGCNRDWNVALYAQKIEGTSKIIYKYDAWGGRDTHIAGYTIMDSTETFKVKIDELLPIHLLDGMPNKNYISAVEINDRDINKSTICTPLNTEILNICDITMKIKKYNYDCYKERGQGLEEYDFESFKETRDSIFFYNLDDNYFEEPSPHLDILKLRKGNVVIMQDKNKKITKIEIENLILSKHRDEFISSMTYYLHPKETLNSNVFSDYGTFKEVIN